MRRAYANCIWTAVCFAILIGLMGKNASAGEMEFRSQSNGRLLDYEDLVQITDLGVSSADDFDGLGVSPDGESVAIEARRASIQDNTVIIRWLVVTLGSPVSVKDVGDGGEPIPFLWHGLDNGNSFAQRPRWSPDSTQFAYRARHGGEIQLWRSDRRGSATQQLTHSAGDVLSFLWSRDGKKIYYTVSESRTIIAARFREEAARGFHFDDRFRPLYTRVPLSHELDFGKTDGTLWTYEIEAEHERLATPLESKEYSGLRGVEDPGIPYISWVRSAVRGSSKVWLEDLRPDKTLGINSPRTLVVLRSSGRGRAVCRDMKCTGRFKGLWISDDGRDAWFLRWENAYDYGDLGLYRWHVGAARVVEILRTSDLIEGCARLGLELICSRESATIPRELVSIALGSGLLTTLYNPNPEFSHFAFGEVSPLSWRDPATGADGFGHLVKPVGYVAGRQYPLLVVQYRSRGFLRGGTGDEYPIHIFSGHGFVVLSYHEPDEWELMPKVKNEIELNERRRADQYARREVLSVLDAGIDKLQREGIVDSNRIGITGVSEGGETVAYGLIHMQGRFAAASVNATYWNPNMFYLVGPKVLPLLRSFGLDAPESLDALNAWQPISVGMNARTISTPLLIHASDSELLPETETFEALRGLSKPVDMYVFPNEHHIKSQPVHRLSIYRRNVQWFDFWLQNREDPMPVDPDQYRRWRTLRAEATSESGQQRFDKKPNGL